jgi:hypothetical protein
LFLNRNRPKSPLITIKESRDNKNNVEVKLVQNLCSKHLAKLVRKKDTDLTDLETLLYKSQNNNAVAFSNWISTDRSNDPKSTKNNQIKKETLAEKTKKPVIFQKKKLNVQAPNKFKLITPELAIYSYEN